MLSTKSTKMASCLKASGDRGPPQPFLCALGLFLLQCTSTYELHGEPAAMKQIMHSNICARLFLLAIHQIPPIKCAPAVLAWRPIISSMDLASFRRRVLQWSACVTEVAFHLASFERVLRNGSSGLQCTLCIISSVCLVRGN